MILIAALLLPQVKVKEERFLTEQEALRLVFKDAAVVRCEVGLDARAREAVERRLGRRVEERFTLFTGTKNGKVVGRALIVEEIGKYLPITFIVGVDPGGRVIDVGVLVHREPIGSDCAKRRFLDFLPGKTLRDPIRKNRDIEVIVGATLSCNGVARGTRKVLAILDALQEEEVRQQRYRMGTLCTITAKGKAAKEAVEAAFAEIQRLDDLLSDYKEDSELSRCNRGEIRPGPEMRKFLDASLAYARDTSGAFDITVGAAVRAWGFRDRKFRVPSDDELKSLVVGHELVKPDEPLPKGMVLDPGAIGKGYAVDAAVAILRKHGISEALVDFGSSIYGFGRDWSVAIRDPFDPDRTIGAVTLRDEGLGVSGHYENFFEQDGKRYAHILDPRTRRPVEGSASAAVIAKTATEADVYSTAIFVEPKLAEGRAALVIPADPKAKRIATPEWSKRFKGE